MQQLICDALAAEIARAHRVAKSSVRADEQVVGLWRARLALDLAGARDWWDLIRRMRDKGNHLREAGGGLALYGAQGGARLCEASEMGFSPNQLARRFRAAVPGEFSGDRIGNATLCASVTRTDESEFIDLDDVIRPLSIARPTP